MKCTPTVEGRVPHMHHNVSKGTVVGLAKIDGEAIFQAEMTPAPSKGAYSSTTSPIYKVLIRINPLTAHQSESEPATPSVLHTKPAYTLFLVRPLQTR